MIASLSGIHQDGTAVRQSRPVGEAKNCRWGVCIETVLNAGIYIEETHVLQNVVVIAAEGRHKRATGAGKRPGT